jgi:uncharacterized protein (TIGR00251 family)
MSNGSKPFTIKGDSILLKVKAFPKARETRILGVRNGELVVRIQASPLKGKANKELVKFLAKMFAIPRLEIQILSGETSRHKILRLPGSALTPLEEAL